MMRRSVFPRWLCLAVIPFFAVTLASRSEAQVNTREPDMLVPAGTLLRCTMSEPNFSSATVQVGDPVLCHLSGVTEFGRAAFPRGAYLGGHLDAVKEPGHFWGKGYLKIVFDRIGLPNADATLDAKIVAAQGQKVNRDGDIRGKGHAKRDAIEWMLPPMWPWKVLMLPARGPRPTLKGEQVLTLRLMEDVVVPKLSATNFNSRDWRPPVYASQDFAPRAMVTPSRDVLSSEDSAAARVSTAGYVTPSLPLADLRTRTNVSAVQESESTQLPAETHVGNSWQAASLQGASLQGTAVRPASAQLTLLALKTETIYAVTQFWVESDRVSYVLPSGTSGEAPLTEVDWARTTELNSERGVPVVLRARQTY
ncbi:MAG TPA: hypothetical protein VJP87_05110 [Candidatus Acidoferrales bacterium]|nr:hypothetical protein [Candidatus Acidoferrales bacterium]